MQQKLFQFFLPQEAEAFGSNRKGTVKATPKIEKICILNDYREYLLCLQYNASGSFLQECINLVEQQLKFSHFEGSINVRHGTQYVSGFFKIRELFY